MSVVQSDSRQRKRFWPELLLAATIVVGTVLYAGWSLREARRYPNVVVEAPAFVWPSRCPPRAYGREFRVPKLCRAGRYQLDDTRLGLVTTGRNNRWYRIGDDALLLSCFRLGNDCTIVNSVPGKFIRPISG